jgi:hypothetical protein
LVYYFRQFVIEKPIALWGSQKLPQRTSEWSQRRHWN